MKTSYRGYVVASLAAALGACAHAAETLSYRDLVARITDLERLASPVNPAERVALASSYDRASRYDAATDRYIAWDANGDGVGVVREEKGQQVLAEIEGPGCIWRIWAATVGSGRVKIYLDGATTPAVDLPFSAYFDGKHEPFTRPNLVYTTTANGVNNFIPMAFQRSCRIVAEKGWGRYFQFTYTRFAPDTQLPTFALPLSAVDAAVLDVANRKLGACGPDAVPSYPGQKSIEQNVVVAPGQKSTVAKLSGPAAITSLRLRADLPSDPAAQRRVLRELTLSITWDGAREPAVWSPLGDFFGTSTHPTPFATVPVGYRDGQWYSHWYMPFGRSAELTVTNDGAETVRLEWTVTHAPLRESAERLLRFHAKWHGDLAPLRSDRAPDWRLLETRGAGRFVGTQLHVWNPRGGWWGEGDEKFFVDGEKFPSTFGTGTEDYFGYAWSSGKTFVQALHSQPVNEDNRGHVSVNRWHLADAVPFNRSFEAALEKYFPNSNPTLFRAVAYWYLAPDGTDSYAAVPVSERIVSEVRPPVWREAGVLEAESMTIVRKEAVGYVGKQAASERHLAAGVCSNDRLLAWWLQGPGNRLELGLPVTEPGKYRVWIRPLRDRTFGMFKVLVDGHAVGGAFDAFTDGKAELPAAQMLGDIELTAGDHVLTIECAGKNPKGETHHFAFDYVKLERVK